MMYTVVFAQSFYCNYLIELAFCKVWGFFFYLGSLQKKICFLQWQCILVKKKFILFMFPEKGYYTMAVLKEF